MPANLRDLVASQVQRVRRRLMMVNLLGLLVGFWALGFLVCSVWFLVRPFVTAPTAQWASYGIPSAIMVGATMAAVLCSFLRAPHKATASLALDTQFELKERVTTFSMLSPEQLTSPAGLALLEDVHEKVANLDIAGRFPVKVRAGAAAMAFGAGLLALAASFFNPSFSVAGNKSNAKQIAAIDAKEIQQQLDNLRKVVKKENDGEDLPKSKEMEELEKEWDKLVQKPLDPTNKEQVRERSNELAKLEEKIQKRVEDLKDKSFDLKKHLDKMLLDKDGKKLEDGPAKDLEDALAKGKFNKAREVLEKLQKDLENKKLSREEMKKLAEQMKQLEEKIRKVTSQKDRKDQLEKDFKEGKISKEQLQREMADLKKEAQELKGLEELADMLGECKECLGKGDNLKAGQKAKGAGDKLKAIELTDAEMNRLLSDQSILRSSMDEINDEINGDLDANGNRKSKRAGGIRPIGEDPDSKNIDTHEKGVVDPTGQQMITGFSRGGNFKKIPSTEVGGAFQRAVQEAPEAMERQRIPTDAEAQVRGYFQKLGRQKE